jgi:hypothetical protein
MDCCNVISSKANCGPSVGNLDLHQEKYLEQHLYIQVPPDLRSAYLELAKQHHNVLSLASFDNKAMTEILFQACLTNGEPIYIKQSKITDAHCNAVQCQVAEWLWQGLIQPAHSKLNTPLYAITDQEQGLHIVQDLPALNAQT